MITEFSKRTNIPIKDILGRCRKPQIADVRHLYWKLLHEQKKYGWSKIARLNDVSHSSVIHGVNKVNTLLEIKDNRLTKLWDEVKDIEI